MVELLGLVVQGEEQPECCKASSHSGKLLSHSANGLEQHTHVRGIVTSKIHRDPGDMVAW
jgi:hypothetical protein